MVRIKGRTLAHYFMRLEVAYHEAIALVGFMIFMIIYSQIISGIMLAQSLFFDPMNIPLSREEESHENLYIDEWFYIHERGVDYLMFFLFFHLFRKMYLTTFNLEQESAWKSGVFIFLLVQVTTFFGLVLCCTHLSDITLTIATNAFQTFFMFVGKLYWLLFTDQTLNSDTVVRMAQCHYWLGIITGYFAIDHGIDMHHDWKTEYSLDGITNELSWYDEAFANEVGKFKEAIVVLTIICLYLFTSPEALSYEIFMWGDVGMQVDVRFYGVAPHWYFRPYMAWLITCPYHYSGILGLVMFFVCFYYQPNIVGRRPDAPYGKIKAALMEIVFWIKLKVKKNLIILTKITPDFDLYYQLTYAIFLTFMWYAFSYLPYGRFFNRLGGNPANFVMYAYIYIYLGTNYLRAPQTYFLFQKNAV